MGKRTRRGLARIVDCRGKNQRSKGDYGYRHYLQLALIVMIQTPCEAPVGYTFYAIGDTSRFLRAGRPSPPEPADIG